MKEYIISSNTTIIEAYARLESLSNKQMTLYVIDKENKLLGSLTDGDIRRCLLKGGNLKDYVTKAMNINCKSLFIDKNDFVHKIHELKKIGLESIPVVNDCGCLFDIIDLVHFKSKLPIDAVLMAGGKGERLRPLTEKTPKPLIKVGDKCIIDYNIDNLIQYGVEHINVTVNYLGEQLEEHFSELRNGIKINTIREPQYLGTIGSIRFIKSFYNDTILVMNSDLFTNIDYEDFYLHFKEHDADMSVVAVPYNVSIPLGIIDLDGRNVKGIIEKPKYNYYANAGIYLLKKTALAEIPDNKFFHATDLIEKLISESKKVIRYPLNGTWIDIGQQADLAKARELVKHM